MQSIMETILIAEDDELLNKALADMLSQAGYTVRQAYDYAHAQKLLREPVNLLVADVGLPDGTGVALCRQAKEEHNIPVLFLTARDAETDIVYAFDHGADDYLVKPVSMVILLKHVEAVLRRSGRQDGAREQFSYRDLRIDYLTKRVEVGGKPVHLTPREYGILELLARNYKKVLTKQMILEQVWDSQGNFVEENTLNVTLNRLKKKIEPVPSEPIYIKNVFGLGYTLGEA